MRYLFGLIVICVGCNPCWAIEGPTAAEINEPCKLTVDAAEVEWVIIGEGVASTSHAGGKWAIVYADTAGEVTCVAAHVRDGKPIIETHRINVGGVEQPKPNKLDKLFADAVAGKVPPDQRPTLKALAQNFRAVAGLINAGKIDGSKESVETALAHLNTGTIGGADEWAELGNAINGALDAIEAGGGLNSPDDYKAALLSIARVLESEVGNE